MPASRTLAVTIRGIAVGEGGKGMLLRVLYREAIVGLLGGLTIGVTTGVCARLWAVQHCNRTSGSHLGAGGRHCGSADGESSSSLHHRRADSLRDATAWI